MTRDRSVDVASALMVCGAPKLPKPAREWIANRMDRFGPSKGNNLGGLLCTFPHVGGHEEDPEQCVRVKSSEGYRYVSRFPSLEVGAAVLVAIAKRASANPASPECDLDSDMSGYKSTFPLPGEHNVSGFNWSDINPWSTSDEAKERFRLMQADWESFEGQGVPEKYPFLKNMSDSWKSFRDAWLKGDPDVTALSSHEAEANMVRRYISERTKDPKFDDSHLLKGGDIVDASPGLKTANTVDQKAREAEDAAKKAATAIPMRYKIGVAAFAAVALGVLLRR